MLAWLKAGEALWERAELSDAALSAACKALLMACSSPPRGRTAAVLEGCPFATVPAGSYTVSTNSTTTEVDLPPYANAALREGETLQL